MVMIYRVGDKDVTPAGKPRRTRVEKWCEAITNREGRNYICTWAVDDHPDVHVAGDGDVICAVWNADDGQFNADHYV